MVGPGGNGKGGGGAGPAASPEQGNYTAPAFYEDDALFDKPNLSIIDEERSPKNGAVISPAPSADDGPREGAAGDAAGDAADGDAGEPPDPPRRR